MSAGPATNILLAFQTDLSAISSLDGWAYFLAIECEQARIAIANAFVFGTCRQTIQNDFPTAFILIRTTMSLPRLN
ncbi:hypothetical protein [Nitrosococcus watsonii]|uniref:Uncharacterized protein n=1 Tax=Nitrosococcus watsoni (strain C-113) TaxID=105559 RepID=D8K7H9_NITWC|nr:hypothetical protein [Nitrosococcus watsonii]ADJ28856.1 hypothetical protein Nwat_2022 [Nitrosococcus watsonii C-113]